MALPTVVSAGLEALGIPHRTHEPLVKKTWWRAGGPADVYVEAGDEATVLQIVEVARETRADLFVLGNASNLLVSDAGIRGIVLRLGGELAQATELSGRQLALGGGLKLASFLTRALRSGWTGLELFAGIPGTVGGAVRMNAGTALGEVKDRLLGVRILTRDGQVEVRPVEQLNMSYRHCELPEGAVVLSARFQLTDEDPTQSRHKVEEHLEYRSRTQPVDVPTCGSTFRNPPGEHAGRLIDRCGLKGLAIGGAVVSEKHANFLVNTGTATAADLRRLIETVQHRVAEQTGIVMQPEVHFAGDWTDWPSP
jgi:UDP-N-acetylmuramate dehydrogenase